MRYLIQSPIMSLPDLKSNFAGDLIVPTDPTYNEVRKIWNASIDKKPSMIARCKGTADVIAAVNYGRTNGMLTSIRGGGHNVGGRSLCDDGLVIDLSLMRAVYVDPANRTVRVQGGTTLGDMDRETHPFGLTVPVGIVPKTGVAGLTLGGGVGWLVRKYGMSIDNLLACQVVTADGQVLTASLSENEDPFWALRGGGGNFGVVTSFEFRAHPVHTVLGGMIVYPRPAALDVIRNFRDFMLSAPDEVTAYCALLHTPDGFPVVGVIPCYCGDLQEGLRVLEPLRKFGTPVMDMVQPLPFPAMQSLLSAAFPDGNQNYWKAAMASSLSDEAIQAAIDSANGATSPMSAIVFEYYAGAAGRVPNDATAFSHRDMPWHMVILAQWTDPAVSAPHRTWARDAAAALQPFTNDAQFLGVLDSDDGPAKAFGANLPRLAAIKKKYDPSNFFRVNQNIEPAIP